MPIKYLPKALLMTAIGVTLFMNMPDSVTRLPDWAFVSIFMSAMLVGWLVAEGLFKAVLWYFKR